jgi:N-formylglutamate amidohydrolase
MEFATWQVDHARALIATAVHNGHDLRPEVRSTLCLDEDTRLREEDPHTASLAASVGSHVAVNRSRFEVDLNRPRDTAVYQTPDDAWGLELWSEPPSPALVRRSRELHDRFYARLGKELDRLVDRHGGFVLYDVHSYNQRRNGPGAPPDPSAHNPTVNLGTGSLPSRWRPVANAFLQSMGAGSLEGLPIDARENVKFEGRHVAAFVHDHFGEVGCALAIEFKKVFMDEWSHTVDLHLLQELGKALAATTDPVLEAWGAACR